jgi:hypothetical protein
MINLISSDLDHHQIQGLMNGSRDSKLRQTEQFLVQNLKQKRLLE